MSPEIIALIILGAVALLFAGLVCTRPQLRRQRLRMRFGPEYDHVIRDRQDRETAELELLARERRHKELTLRPLDRAVRERYRAEWFARAATRHRLTGRCSATGSRRSPDPTARDHRPARRRPGLGLELSRQDAEPFRIG